MAAEYRVLAQKYRPSCLQEIIGQETLTTTLTNAIKNNQMPHAFTFTGVRGTGKTSTARIIALSLNCLNKPPEASGTLHPCHQCAACIAIQEGRHIDVIEMDAASHTGVDDIRELIEAARYRPLQATYKIYIIDEAHMLSKSAFNALLKTLEEPPAHVKFILATTEIRKIPLTILSRCMRFDLQRITTIVLKEYYAKIAAKEDVEITSGALQLIAEMAEGSVRDGLSLLEQAFHLPRPISETAVRTLLGRADKQGIIDLFTFLLQGKIQDALNQARKLYNEGAEPESLLCSLLECVHCCSLYKTGDCPPTQDATLQEIGATISFVVLNGFWQILLKGLEELARTPSALMALEMILIRLSYVKNLPSLEATFTEKAKQSTVSLSSSAPSLITETTQTVEKVKEENPSSKLPKNFEELVQLVAQAREPLLYTHLIQDVEMIAYQPGHLILNILPDAPPHFLSDLKKFLELFTKNNWTIENSSQTGNSSLKKQQQMASEQQIEDCKQDPLVQEALNLFSGSVIDQVMISPDTIYN